MKDEPRFLLIVGCSGRKRQAVGLLPAMERYDGVNYRVLQRAKKHGNWPATLDVLIVSAEFGLLPPQTPISCYDRLMTRKRAMGLHRRVSADLDRSLAQWNYEEVFINLGKTYLPTGCATSCMIFCAHEQTGYCTSCHCLSA